MKIYRLSTHIFDGQQKTDLSGWDIPTSAEGPLRGDIIHISRDCADFHASSDSVDVAIPEGKFGIRPASWTAIPYGDRKNYETDWTHVEPRDVFSAMEEIEKLDDKEAARLSNRLFETRKKSGFCFDIGGDGLILKKVYGEDGLDADYRAEVRLKIEGKMWLVPVDSSAVERLWKGYRIHMARDDKRPLRRNASREGNPVFDRVSLDDIYRSVKENIEEK